MPKFSKIKCILPYSLWQLFAQKSQGGYWPFGTAQLDQILEIMGSVCDKNKAVFINNLPLLFHFTDTHNSYHTV